MMLTLALAWWLAGAAVPTPDVGPERAPRAPDKIVRADLDGDGVANDVELYVDAERTRGVVRDGAVSSGVYPAWDVAAGRFAGEVRGVLALGVWSLKGVPKGGAPRRSIWIVARDGSRFFERWRGSRLSRPFDRFTLADVDRDGGSELVTASCDERGRQALTVYRWSGFGFDGVGHLARAGRCSTSHGAPHTNDPIDTSRLALLDGELRWLDD